MGCVFVPAFGWLKPRRLCTFVLICSVIVIGEDAFAAQKHTTGEPEKAGQTADIHAESLSPKPRPAESKAKKTAEDAKRRLDSDIASAPFVAAHA